MTALPLLLALLTPGQASDDLTVLTARDVDAGPRKMLHGYLLEQAGKHFDARREAIGALKTPADLGKRQQELKAHFIAALGGFPERTPLKARTVGRLEGDGYVVERVIYESRPDHHVTASLYLPHGKGPFPGVLMPIGHSTTGKAADYVQRGCILLARNGLAVLAYDPIGQGERRQLLDAKGDAAIRGSTTEHTLTGIGALLVGGSTATYRIWDGIRSLDYLAGRPEVDPKRLGCTGCSGGGTLTSYLMALDERIVAAAPSCYITSLERLFATIGPQDAEQNIPGQVAFGMEHADYLSMRAPRPTLICAASRDFFDIQGTWTSFREAKLLYGLLGHSERVELAEYDTPHGYPRQQREAVVRWMRRWLLEKDDAPKEEEQPIRTVEDLQCTRTGQVLSDLNGISVFQLNARRAAELARQRAARKPDAQALLKEVRRLLALPDTIKAARVREAGTLKREGYSVRKLVFETEPGILVPALRLAPARANRPGPLVVYLDGDGMKYEAGPGGRLELLVKSGHEVLALDVRGMGETSPSPEPARRSFFGAEYKESFLAMHLARPLLGQRVLDVLAVLASVRAEDQARQGPIQIHGSGAAGLIALHAAALEPAIGAVTVERSILSWEDVAAAPISHGQLASVVPGVLEAYDLPELAATLTPRKLHVHAPVDPLGEPVNQAEIDRAYQACRDAYRQKGAEKGLILERK